ncbi:MAG: hypothetical protein ABWK05_06405 [Pyrobaculum sp.]
MIFLYTNKLLEVELPQVLPACEVTDRRVVPLVKEDLQCLQTVLKKASQGVVLKTRSRLLVALVRELRPDLMVYVWGLGLRKRGIVPIYPAEEYRGPAVYYVKTKAELEELRGEHVEGLLLDVRGFDPYLVDLAVRGKVGCKCTKCDVVERLLCDPYRELEVL